MSVTFHPAQRDSDITGWAVACACGSNQTAALATTPDAVANLLPTHTPGCADEWCNGERGGVAPVLAIEAPEINVANGNARIILDALGFPDGDLCGAATGQDFLGRVLMARAIAPADEGMLAHAVVPGSRMTDCGRRPGYLQDKLDRLQQVAEWAINCDRDVVWA